MSTNLAIDSDRDAELRQHRVFLLEAEQKAQEDYDKTLITLSGGALGISFAFVKDIVGNQSLNSPLLLMGAWLMWTISLTATLFSFYFSRRAIETEIVEIDAELSGQPSKPSTPKRRLSTSLTSKLNGVSGVAFVLGVFAMGLFVMSNLGLLP